MKPKYLWMACGVAALLSFALAAQKLQSHYLQRESLLEIDNVRLHERLFLEIAKGELVRQFPETACDVTPSGGVERAGGRYGFTTINDVLPQQRVSPDKLAEAARNLSSNLQVTDWTTQAEQRSISRFCRFEVMRTGERPYIRMVMHESNYPAGLSEVDLMGLFGGSKLPPAEVTAVGTVTSPH